LYALCSTAGRWFAAPARAVWRDKVQVMLHAIPGPGTLALADDFVGVDGVTSDRKKHRSHRDKR
jgi:hypothetical protein